MMTMAYARRVIEWSNTDLVVVGAVCRLFDAAVFAVVPDLNPNNRVNIEAG